MLHARPKLQHHIPCRCRCLCRRDGSSRGSRPLKNVYASSAASIPASRPACLLPPWKGRGAGQPHPLPCSDFELWQRRRRLRRRWDGMFVFAGVRRKGWGRNCRREGDLWREGGRKGGREGGNWRAWGSRARSFPNSQTQAGLASQLPQRGQL